MAPQAKNGVVIADFIGLVTNIGAIANDEAVQAASVQENLVCTRPAEVSTRPGLRRVSFDDED